MEIFNALRDENIECLRVEIARTDVNLTNFYDQTPLMCAAAISDSAFTAELIKADADLEIKDADGKTALLIAVLKGNVDNVKLLVKAGANPNVVTNEGMSLLQYACCLNNSECIEVLLNAKIPLKYSDEGLDNPLGVAASLEKEEICNYLLDKGFSPDCVSMEGTPLVAFLAAKFSERILRCILRAHPNLNLRDNRGRTALMLATIYGSDENVFALLEAGADVNLLDKSSSSALHVAALENRYHVAKALIRCGANLNGINEHTHTPLSLAAGTGQLSLVKLLIEKGADLDIICADGLTALGGAVANGHEEVVKTLLVAGARTDIVDERGRNTLEFAEYKGNTEIILAVSQFAEQKIDYNISNFINSSKSKLARFLDFRA